MSHGARASASCRAGFPARQFRAPFSLRKIDIMISRSVFVAGGIACFALAACEHQPGAAAPRLAPSPAAQASAAASALPVPADDAQRAAAVLGEHVEGWTVRTRPGARTRTDAASFAGVIDPNDLAAATAALNQALHGATAPAPKDPPE
jgi:hypothetical protein